MAPGPGACGQRGAVHGIRAFRAGGRPCVAGFAARSGSLESRGSSNSRKTLTHGGEKMKKYQCDVCGYVYDPAVGDPDGGIAPGTAFEDIPADWVCPVCGAAKDDFSPVED